MGKRKYTMWGFRENDGGAFSEYLEKMAKKGWYLKKISLSGINCFERGEPKTVHCAAVVMPDSSQFDSENREEVRRFREYCEETGWKLRYGGSIWQIFYSDEETPIPIETDDALRVEAVKSVMLRPGNVVTALIITAIFAISVFILSSNPESLFSSYRKLADSLFLLFISCNLLFTMIVQPLVWCWRSKRCIETGKPFPVTSFRQIMRRDILLYLFLSIFLILRESRDLNSALTFLSSCAVIILVIMLDTGILGLIKKKEEMTRGAKIVVYAVSAIIAGWILTGILGAVQDRVLPDGKEEPVYIRLVDYPIDFEALGYETKENHHSESGKTFLALHQGESMSKIGEEDEENGSYIQVNYTLSSSRHIIQRIRRYYLKQYKSDEIMELTERRMAGGVLIERYRYTENDNLPEDGWWLIRDVCILSRGDQIFTLESTDEMDCNILEQAVRAMSE